MRAVIVGGLEGVVAVRRLFTAIALTVCLSYVSLAQADPWGGGDFQYPRVYNRMGRLYGPTMAHDQYRRQYGQEWHGYRGLSARGYGGSNINIQFSYPPGALGYYYAPQSYYVIPPAPYGWGGYGPYGYDPYGPIGMYPSPYQQGDVYQPFYDNSVLDEARQENDARWNSPLPNNPAAELKPKPMVPSPEAAQLTSVRAQAQGDEAFRRQDFNRAVERYEQASQAAPERVEMYFRKGVALAISARYSLAAREFRRGLEIDPYFAPQSVKLIDMFGQENVLAKGAMIDATSRYVNDDIRDPDRLFLLGMLMYLDGDDRSRVFFESALRLRGHGDHLLAMLQATQPATAQPAAPEQPVPQANPQAAPVPRALPKSRTTPRPPAPADEGIELPVPPLPAAPPAPKPQEKFELPVPPANDDAAATGPILRLP